MNEEQRERWTAINEAIGDYCAEMISDYCAKVINDLEASGRLKVAISPTETRTVAEVVAELWHLRILARELDEACRDLMRKEQCYQEDGKYTYLETCAMRGDYDMNGANAAHLKEVK